MAGTFRRGDLVERRGVKGTVTYVGEKGWVVVPVLAPDGVGHRIECSSGTKGTPADGGWAYTDGILTTTEAASVLGCSPQSVINWIRDGQLVCAETTPGGHRRIRRSEVDRFWRQLRGRA